MPESARPPGSRKYKGYFSPAPGDISEHQKTILSHVYSAARKAGGGGEDKEAKAKAARIAWAAVNKAKG